MRLLPRDERFFDLFTKAGTIVWAWILTIPMSAAIAGLTYLAIR